MNQLGGQRFTRQRRLRHHAEFQHVYRGRACATDAVLVVNAAPNDRSSSRLGLSVSRAVGGAVVRNKWKRLIREAFRRSLDRIPVGLDFVVRPRRGAAPDYQAIVESLVRLTCQLARSVLRE